MILTGTTAGTLLACGDDEGFTEQPDAAAAVVPNDASTAVDSGPTNDASIGVDSGPASAAPVAVYPGTVAKLDASSVAASDAAAATFTWTIQSVPTGSAVTTASLVDPTTATPSFVPDRVGAYNLTLQTGGVTTLFRVNAVDASVFYFRTTNDGGATSAATVSVVGAFEGDGGAPVSCFTRDAGAYTNELVGPAQRASDVWEGPPGQPSRIVYAFETREDGGAHTSLLASTSTSTCATAPVKLDEADVRTGTPSNSGAPSSRSLEQPVLSPSGNRVAYLRTLPTGTTVATVGFDGSARRDLAPFYVNPDGTPAPATTTAPTALTTRPIWIDESTVAWAESLGASSWRIVAASDEAAATPAVRMTCTSTPLPRQFAVLPDGDVIASSRDNTAAPESGSLVRYSVDPTTKACTSPRTFGTNITSFVLSADRTKIAYNGFGDTALHLALTDGGALSAVVPGLDNSNVSARWIAGGNLVSFTGRESAFDASAVEQSIVAVVQLDGGNLHQVTVPDGASALSTVGSGFCAMGRGYASSTVLFGMLGVVGLGLARRRKKG